MRRLNLLLRLLFACASLQAQPAAQQNYTADLNYVATQLPQLHANFFFQLSPDDFNQAVTQLTSQIPNLTDSEFYVRLAGLVAMAGDPHTALYLASAAGFQQLPLQFRWLDDGVFVTAAAPDYARALGAKLVSVGNFGIDAVENQLAAIVPHSNSEWVHHTGAQFLSVKQVLEGLDLVTPGAPVPLTFQDHAGNQFTLSVSPETAALAALPDPAQGPIPLYLQHPDLNYWFNYVAPLKLLYFKYNRCAEMPSQSFGDFANSLLQALDSNPVNTLVFDFRSNGGGDASIILPLFNGIQQRYPALLANPNLRVYDVIDQGTFSSALDNAMSMKSAALSADAQFPGAGLANLLVVIGQASGGPTSGYGEVQTFTLPSGKMQGQYSTTYHPAPADIADAPAFLPDVAVPYISSDYFARHDPVLAALLARWSGAPPPPTGSAFVVNAASFRVEQGLAPGSLAAASGTFSAVPDTVLVSGQAATLLSASSSQVTFVVPAAAPTGAAGISVQSGGQEVGNAQVTLSAAAPALFVQDATNPAQPGLILNQDSTGNSASAPAAARTMIQITATGNGPLDFTGSAPVTVIAGGLPAAVPLSAPVSPGMWQVNALLPAQLTGQVPLFIIAGNSASNGVTVAVQ
jgi:uncharacterized protein (TIGR03437 family)